MRSITPARVNLHGNARFIIRSDAGVCLRYRDATELVSRIIQNKSSCEKFVAPPRERSLINKIAGTLRCSL